jgi:hypothetical protein
VRLRVESEVSFIDLLLLNLKNKNKKWIRELQNNKNPISKPDSYIHYSTWSMDRIFIISIITVSTITIPSLVSASKSLNCCKIMSFDKQNSIINRPHYFPVNIDRIEKYLFIFSHKYVENYFNQNSFKS